VDAVFVTKNLEMSPTKTVPKAGESIPALFTPQNVDATKQEKLTHVLHRVALLCETRGVVLKYCFQDFDRSNCGSVTKAQFRQNFPFLQSNGLTEEDLEVLVDRYTDTKDTVHYRALHEDVSKNGDVLDVTQCPQSLLVLRPDQYQWTQADLTAEDKIQAKVVEKRVRLRDYFKDFDHLRKGFCTTGQVRTVLAILGLEVAEPDMRALFERYTIPEDGLFNYSALTQKIDSAFTQIGLESTPTARISMPDAESTLPARRNKIKSAPEEQGRMDEIDESLRARVRERRLNLVSFFQDFDRSRRGHVSKGQFARVMATMAVELKVNDVDALCKRYCDLGNHTEFNYLDFCAACDPPSDAEKQAMLQTMQPYEPPALARYFDERGNVCPLKVN
jgi:Ca2+-binding EF-hand superfamily protein